MKGNEIKWLYSIASIFIVYIDYTVEIMKRVGMVCNSEILAPERRNQEDCKFIESTDYMTRIFSKIIVKKERKH